MLVLESSHLMLRHFEPDDLGPLAALYSDPDIRRYYPDGVRTLEETREELEWFRCGHPERPELGLWAGARGRARSCGVVLAAGDGPLRRGSAVSATDGPGTPS